MVDLRATTLLGPNLVSKYPTQRCVVFQMPVGPPSPFPQFLSAEIDSVKGEKVPQMQIPESKREEENLAHAPSNEELYE